MGVPKFASWIKKKYPGISAKGASSYGNSKAGAGRRRNNSDSSSNDPNGPPCAKVPDRIAALYVDMNGIIHPCCHSEDDPRVAAASREEKIARVCQAVDNLVKTLQPEALLYLAMDGVAPRAKMNQQRSRRYMAAVAKHGVVKDGGFAPDHDADDDDRHGNVAGIQSFSADETEEGSNDNNLQGAEMVLTANNKEKKQSKSNNNNDGEGDIGESLVASGKPTNKNDDHENSPLPVVVGDDLTSAAGILDLGIYSVSNNKNSKPEKEELDDPFMDMGSTPSRSEVESNHNNHNLSPSTAATTQPAEQQHTSATEKNNNDSNKTTTTTTTTTATKPGKVYDENFFGGFDSNCISPGTDFMAAITVAVRDLAKTKLANGEWSKDLAVIVSGSEEPGEGEHKLIDFMRRFSPSAGWPRGAHVIHGLDADLILLCLTLHISNVFILRDNDRTVVPLTNDENSNKNKNNKNNLSTTNSALTKNNNKNNGNDNTNNQGKKSKKTTKKNEDDDDQDEELGAEKNEDGSSSSSSSSSSDDEEEEDSSNNMMIRSPSRSPAMGPGLISAARAKELSKQGAASSARKSSMLTATPHPGENNARDLPEINLCPPANAASVSSGEKKGKFNSNNNNKNTRTASNNNNNKNNKKEECTPTGPTLTSKQEVFDIFLVAEYIVAEIATLAVSIHGPSIYEHVANNGRQIINDFVFLASILGNDFMPRLPSAFAGEAAMDNVYEIYVRNVLGKGFITSPPTASGNSASSSSSSSTRSGDSENIQLPKGSNLCKDVNLHALSLFMEGYAEIEAALFRRFSVSVAKYLPDDASNASGVGFVESTDKVWADKYYNSTTCTKESRRDACAKFLEGMRFVFEYYAQTSSSCSWRWFYPYHHAPFAHDFSAYLKELIAAGTSPLAPPVEIEAPSPFVQLLCILPPSSLSLLPFALRKILVFPPENLTSSFPHEWKVDFTCAEGQEHLSTVMIPFADLEGITVEVQKVLGEEQGDERKKITEEERRRGTNQRELSCIICHDGNKFLKKNDHSFSVAQAPTSIKNAMKTSAEDRISQQQQQEALQQKSKVILHDGGFAATLMNLQLENLEILSSSSNGGTDEANSTANVIHQSSFSIPEPPAEKVNANGKKTPAPSAHDAGARRHFPQGLITVPQLPALPTNWGRLTSARRVLPSFGTHLGEILLYFILGVASIFVFLMILLPSTTTTTSSTSTVDATTTNSSATPATTTTVTHNNHVSFSMTQLFQILAVLVPLFWFITAIWLPRPGATYRNQIRDIYCDWLCRECGSVTFTSGLLCFRCGAPYEEEKCPRVFASRLPKTPPVLSVDHSPHLIDCLLKIDKKFVEAAEATQ